MDENEFRDTYNRVNTTRCHFEKVINAHRCACSQAQRFILAGRDCVRCESADQHLNCNELLTLIRNNARFALHLTRIGGPLPHNKEMRIQAGGLLGLQLLLHPDITDNNRVGDISDVVSSALEQFYSLDKLPFDEIIKSVLTFKGRVKRKP